jgi:hypothetical protein
MIQDGGKVATYDGWHHMKSNGKIYFTFGKILAANLRISTRADMSQEVGKKIEVGVFLNA